MKLVYTLLILLLLSTHVHASHLRGGEILASHVSGQTYSIKVRIYGDMQKGEQAMNALTSVSVCMGDGSVMDLPRLSIAPIGNSGSVSVAEYQGTHTYPTSGIYQISVALQDRTAQILNFPNSENTSQFLWTVIDTQLSNSTPVLPNLELEAGVRQVFSIDLKPTVADPDSITIRVARLSKPSPGTCGVRMQDHSYLFPNEVSATGTFRIEQNKLIWTAPEMTGNYLFAMTVVEWRAGAKISESYREGMVTVIDRPGQTVEVPPYESAEYGGVVTSTPVVSSPEISMAIQAYPVPTDDYVTVKAYSKRRANIRLQLIDMNGRVLRETHSKNLEISMQEQFDMRRLASGIYLVRASNGKDSVTQKIVR